MSQSPSQGNSAGRPWLIISPIVRFYKWNRLLLHWAGIVVRPVLAIFIIASSGQLLITLGQQYQIALISSVVGTLAGQNTSGGSVSLLNSILPDNAWNAALLLVAVIVFMALSRFAFRAVDDLANSRMAASLQSLLHDKLLGLGAEWYDREDSDAGGSLQITNLAPVVQQALALFIKSPLVQGIGVITALIFVLQGLEQLPRTPLWIEVLAGILLLGLPVLAWGLSQSVRYANEAVVAAQKSASTELLNSLSQPLQIQALGGQRQRSARVRERLKALALARFHTAVRSDAAAEFKSALPFLLQALFLVYAVVQTVQAGGLTGSSLGGSLQAIVLIQGLVPATVTAILSVIEIFTGINQMWPQIAAVGEVLDMGAARAPGDVASATNWPESAKEVQFHKVSFSYRPSLPLLLDGLDYEFTPGAITAIVGAAGSGKSTIFQLLTRLRQPTGGRVTISETGLNSIQLDSLRRHIGIVHQSPPFITDTVRANFQLSALDATDAEIETACRKVGIWDTLVAKNATGPLDQHIAREPGGANDFSGGERRRLAVARGLLNSPSILLFDEPTAGIDAHSLELVADAIKRASVGITSIVIEHNLDFILGIASKVCVLSGGHFVQMGDPRELAEKPGPFRDLLEAVRRLAGDSSMTTKSYPMPGRNDLTASGAVPGSPAPMRHRLDSSGGQHADARSMRQRPDRPGLTGKASD